jgi:hypothetical protein
MHVFIDRNRRGFLRGHARRATLALLGCVAASTLVAAPANAASWQSAGTARAQTAGERHFCGAKKSFSTPTGWMTYHQCVAVDFGGGNGARFRALTTAYYTARPAGRSQVFDARNHAFINGVPQVAAYCPPVVFNHRDARWCYGPSRYAAPGRGMAALGAVNRQPWAYSAFWPRGVIA